MLHSKIVMPEEILETPQPTQPVTESKSTDWTKIILVSVLSLGLLAGAAYAGYYYGTQQAQPAKEPTPAVSQPQPEADRPLDETPAEPTTAPVVEDETKDWKTYTETVHSFSLEYPSSWQVAKGNEHAPSIPSSMTEIIKLQSKVGTIDVSIIPWHNNLKKDLREELSSFISSYFGETEVSYESTQLDKQAALRGSYLQSAMGSQTKVILTAVEKGDYVLFLQTQFDIEDSSRLGLYNQILSTFKFLD